MMGPPCLRARALMDRPATALSEAERLLLDEHVGECDACGRHARLTSELRRAMDLGMPALMPEAARERVIENALRGRATERTEVRPPSRWPAAAFGLALAVAVTLVLLRTSLFGPSPGVEERAPEPPGVAVSRPGQPNTDVLHVEKGSFSIDGKPWSGREIPAGAVLAATSDVKLRVRHAELDTPSGSSLSWKPEAGSVVLHGGRVTVTVDPRPHEPFAVAARGFRVEVLGTRFVVDEDSVRVLEGRVRVVPVEGASLTLGAGEQWQKSAPASPSSEPEALPAGSERQPGTPPKAEPNATTLLGEARQELAGGDVNAARALAHRAIAAGPSRRDEAEGRTLLAECAQRAGDARGAARLYERVASGFPEMMAGQTALYAAARAHEAAGDREAARSALQRYLATYPGGRFHKEATKRLGALDRP